MTLQKFYPRGFNSKDLPNGWFIANNAGTVFANKTAPAWIPATFTAGIKLTKEGRVANPEAILGCHYADSILKTVRPLRSILFETVKFTTLR